MQEIKIYCNQGHWRWNIATFVRDEHAQWAQKIIETNRAISAEGKTDDRELWNTHGHMDSRTSTIDTLLKTPSYNWVRDGKEVSGFAAETPQGGNGIAPSYDLFCEQCKKRAKRKKHGRFTTVLAQHQKLSNVLELILEAGQDEISLDHFNTIWDTYNRGGRTAS